MCHISFTECKFTHFPVFSIVPFHLHTCIVLLNESTQNSTPVKITVIRSNQVIRDRII